jgi:hypothetical protein
VRDSKSSVIVVRVSDREKQEFESEAAAAGFDSVSAWIRWLARQGLKPEPRKGAALPRRRVE